MRKTLLLIILFSITNYLLADNPIGKKTESQQNKLNEQSSFQPEEQATRIANKTQSSDKKTFKIRKNRRKRNKKRSVPGKFPSFLWSFLLSAIGSYTLWGIGAGPLSVLIVYFASKKDKKEVRRSIWGWILGTIVGLALWAIFRLV